MNPEPLPDAAYAAALLELPEMFPRRLATLLRVHDPVDLGQRRPAREVWQLALAGRVGGDAVLRAHWRGGDLRASATEWAEAARHIDVGQVWRKCISHGVVVDVLGERAYPPELAEDLAPPAVLFRTGPHIDLAGRHVAVVGTRQASAVGLDVAGELGSTLAAAGVRVVSGLAIGVDGAAHRGALAAGGAPPIGVVAGGFDRPYPARHRVLWEQVAAAGCLVSEWPLGTASSGWRFPTRNRIIAALAEIVVIVESRDTGGSMITAEEALARGRTVMAVPGNVRSEVAAGTNALLRDGAVPMCDVRDVLEVLGLHAPARLPTPRPDPGEEGRAVLAALGGEPVPTDHVMRACGLTPPTTAAALATLELDGWVIYEHGLWRRA